MASAVPKPSMFAVFKKRSFTLLWSAQLISTVGDGLTSIAAGILIYRLTGSALSVGLMLMATALPTLFFGLIAGVFVDRYDRKRIMWVSHLLRAAVVVSIPLLVDHGIAWLYVMVALSAGIGQFFNPAHESVLPEVASEDELAAANSFMAISSFGSTAIGFAAAGLLASRFPIAWAFYIDAATFVLAALLVLGVTVQALVVEDDTSVKAVLRNLREGAHFLFASDILRSLLFLGAGTAVSIGAWNVLLLPFAEQALHANEFVYGLQESLTSVGFVLGSFVLAGMGLAGFADIVDVRIVFAIAAGLTLVLGLVAAVMPGLGLPAAEWRRAVSLLRGARTAARLSGARAATVADFLALAGRNPSLARLDPAQLRGLAAHTLVAEAEPGCTVLKRGEKSDAGYFIISGRVVAGWDEEGGYRPLETLNAGDFFGEIAALTGSTRTANVVAEEPTVLLEVPAATLRTMMADPELNRVFMSRMTERMVRMNMVDLPRFPGMDQANLKNLRTQSPTVEEASLSPAAPGAVGF